MSGFSLISPLRFLQAGTSEDFPRREVKSALARELLAVASMNETEVLIYLGSSLEGLDSAEAAARLGKHGANVIAQNGAPNPLRELLDRASNPLNALLLSLAAVSYGLGDLNAAIVILAIVTLAILMAFIQEHRSNDAAARLRAMVKITTSIRRRGDNAAETPAASRGFQERASETLVPGDIVRLSAGDMIPADLRLLASKNLFVDQSALTGEAMPCEKSAHPSAKVAADPFDVPNLALMGSSVVSGFAVGVIVRTGARTYFGQLAEELAGKRRLTDFDKGISRFIWLMIRFMLVMVPAVFLINGFTKGDWLEALLFAVAVAVGLTPEMLPMIVTVNLAKGAIAMSEEARDRQAPQRHSEFRRDGCLVHRQDRHADAGPDHPQACISTSAAGDVNGRLEYAYLNSHYPVRLEESARRRGAVRHVEPDETPTSATINIDASTKFHSISRAGAFRSFSLPRMAAVRVKWAGCWTVEAHRGEEAGRHACPDLQGRGRGNLRRLRDYCELDGQSATASMRSSSGTGAGRKRTRSTRTGFASSPSHIRRFARRQDELFGRGRKRPDAARLHRLPRPAEGKRRRGYRRAAIESGVAGQGPDRRQRNRHPQDLPRGRAGPGRSHRARRRDRSDERRRVGGARRNGHGFRQS